MTKEIHQTHPKCFYLRVILDQQTKVGNGSFSKCRFNTLPNYIMKACHAIGVVGESARDTFTPHGLLATFITFLIEARHHMGVNFRKYGQLDPRSALSYHNTHGVHGHNLQSHMFDETVPDVQIGLWLTRAKVPRKSEEIFH